MPNARVRYIFTYGTLMSCCTDRQGAAERAEMAAQGRVVGRASIRGRLFDAGACPAAVLTAERRDDRVRGEVWELPADHSALLARLDGYEGCHQTSPLPFPYVRRRIRVRLPDGRRVTAWMYQWVGSTRGLPLVASGAWREPLQPAALIAA